MINPLHAFFFYQVISEDENMESCEYCFVENYMLPEIKQKKSP